jgi:aspartyl-tRNA(Asn)/glutamyl-tRNA(Gln) amidotransferase subunit B
MPELPRQMAERLVQTYGLPEYDATTLTQSPSMAAYFETAAKACGQPKLVSNWIMGEVSRRLNEEGLDISSIPVDAQKLAWLVGRIDDGTISNNAGRKVLDSLWSGYNAGVGGASMAPMTAVGGDAGSAVDSIIESLGLKQMNDSGALEKIIDEVMAANAPMVEQFRAGKDKAFNALVGMVMKASKGKANPQQANDLLRQKLQ